MLPVRTKSRHAPSAARPRAAERPRDFRPAFLGRCIGPNLPPRRVATVDPALIGMNSMRGKESQIKPLRGDSPLVFALILNGAVNLRGGRFFGRQIAVLPQGRIVHSIVATRRADIWTAMPALKGRPKVRGPHRGHGNTQTSEAGSLGNVPAEVWKFFKMCSGRMPLLPYGLRRLTSIQIESRAQAMTHLQLQRKNWDPPWTLPDRQAE